MKKILLTISASILLGSAYSQIALPKEFKCVDYTFTNKKVEITSYPIWQKFKTVAELKKKLAADSEQCCGTYTITKDNLITSAGTTDSEGEGAGSYFFRVYNPKTKTCVAVYSQFKNDDFKNWSDWILRSIRGLSSEKSNTVVSASGKQCK